MIHYFKPYNINGRLFDAYDKAASLVTNPDDWICFLDGDTMFLIPGWGHIIEAYTCEYPNTGIFTSYASRGSYQYIVPKIGDPTNTNILFHISIAKTLEALHAPSLDVKKLERRIAGHLIVVKKSFWEEIRSEVCEKVQLEDKRILGVDTKISNATLARNKDIFLMKAIYLYHLFRLYQW